MMNLESDLVIWIVIGMRTISVSLLEGFENRRS